MKKMTKLSKNKLFFERKIFSKYLMIPFNSVHFPILGVTCLLEVPRRCRRLTSLQGRVEGGDSLQLAFL